MTKALEKPILFSAPMTRAILAGAKTQTRRIVKGIVEECGPYSLEAHMRGEMPLCPYEVGMKLRVKEAAWMWCEKRPNGITPKGKQKWHYVPMREAPVHYRADHPQKPMVDVVSPDTGNTWGWRFKVGRFLPLWASRITLEITGISVERLQDISNDDANQEGAEKEDTFNYSLDERVRLGLRDGSHWGYWNGFKILWDSINGKSGHGWDKNEYVWKYTFRKL